MQNKRRASTARLSGQFLIMIFLLLSGAISCQRPSQRRAVAVVIPPAPVAKPLAAGASPQLKQFIEAAIEQSKITTGYDPAYVGIDYPNGDVATNTGVCSDVIVR